MMGHKHVHFKTRVYEIWECVALFCEVTKIRGCLLEKLKTQICHVFKKQSLTKLKLYIGKIYGKKLF
ncbi:MAG: hypothetical protein EBU52_13500 [Cytophagia bacterium]|nr:hypothetical protein [Cytophagia bacterium]